jgi:hypothetical protein
MAKTRLCPFCFRKFEVDAILWRCSHPACVSPDGKQGEPDEAYADYCTEVTGVKTAPPLMAHVFGPVLPDKRMKGLLPNKNLTTAYCDWCNSRTDKKLCPHCHNEVPYTIASTANHIVALVGAVGVGKSHYMTVLIEMLKNKVGANFGLALQALNDETMKRYDEEFYGPLYEQKKQIVKTQAKTAKNPLMYRLHLNSRGDGRALSLVFFDTAGETFDDEGSLNLYGRYLRHASAIIVLVDPLQMNSIRDQMARVGQVLPVTHTEPAVIIQRLIRQFESFGGTRAGRRTKTPFAVALTKVDALKESGVLGAGSQIYALPRHETSFDPMVAQGIHDEVRSLIQRFKGEELDSLLSAHFARYQYFALSALGGTPAVDGAVRAIAPFRVEDPFLWALTEIGFLKKGKQRP